MSAIAHSASTVMDPSLRRPSPVLARFCFQSPLGLVKLFTNAPLRMRLLQCLPVPSCKAEVFRGGCISLGAHLGAPQMRKSLPLEFRVSRAADA